MTATVASDVSRRHRVDVEFGHVRRRGKLTTYRSMAEDMLNHTERILPKTTALFNLKDSTADRNPQLLDSIRSNASLGARTQLDRR